MDIAEFSSYGFGLLIGLVMGLIGGGGSLLLPTFIYILKKDDVLSTAYTLLLVGVTAGFGAAPRIKAKQVDYPSVIALGIPILIGTIIVRYGIHYVPNDLFEIGETVVTRKMCVLLLFATILLLSFASMLGLIGRKLKPRPNFRQESPRAYFTLLISGGMSIGLISAVIGAGGGVMIVPLLVLVMGLDMKTVVGTSLTIMALKSPISFFLVDAFKLQGSIEWGFLAGFVVVMIVGVMIGTMLAKRIDSEKLKKGFAWFILLMAILIFTKELFFADSTTVESPAQTATHIEGNDTLLVRENEYWFDPDSISG